PLRMREVLRAVGGTARTVGGAIAVAVLAVGRFWADVLRAMLPDRDTDEDDEPVEVDERDVLEVGDDEAASEPVIIGRAKRPRRAAAGLVAADSDGVVRAQERGERSGRGDQTEREIAEP